MLEEVNKREWNKFGFGQKCKRDENKRFRERRSESLQEGMARFEFPPRGKVAEDDSTFHFWSQSYKMKTKFYLIRFVKVRTFI